MIRARDYQKKKEQLVNLKRKAADRNPDEFYFKMNKSKVVGGVHESTEHQTLDVETVKLLKTQDLGYIAHRKAVDDSKARRMKDSLHLIGEESSARDHKIFVETEEEFRTFDPVEHFETIPELEDRTFNRLRKEQLSKISPDAITAKDVKGAMRSRQRSYKELNQRVSRSQRLGSAIKALNSQRIGMSKGSKKKIEDPNGIKPPEFKFKRQRCR